MELKIINTLEINWKTYFLIFLKVHELKSHPLLSFYV